MTFAPMEAVSEDGYLDSSATKKLADVAGHYTFFAEGDVLFAKITPCFENGKRAVASGLCNGLGFGSTEFTVLRPHRNRIDARFLFYLVSTHEFRAFGEPEMLGAGGQKRVPDDYVRDFRVRTPPLDEQRRIAAFLDEQTSQIDVLVREQQRLIELLFEKRDALVANRIMRGLDFDAPLRHSGIEWLGCIPRHWRVLPLKRDLRFLTSGSRGWAKHYSDEGALFIRIGNLTRDGTTLDLSDVQRVDVPVGAEGERTKVRSGDLLFSITAYLGSVAVVPPNVETAFVSQHVALARLAGRYLLPNWVGFAALSYVGKAYLASQGYGGTKIQLALQDVANLVLPVPPIAEQAQIVGRLESEVAQISELADEARRAIGYLRERRSALITEAVSGSINVRDWQLVDRVEAVV